MFILLSVLLPVLRPASTRAEFKNITACSSGGIGRRVGLKIQSGLNLGASSSLAWSKLKDPAFCRVFFMLLTLWFSTLACRTVSPFVNLCKEISKKKIFEIIVYMRFLFLRRILMQVHKTQDYISFGYNQQLNDKLVSKIQNAKKNKEYLTTLLKLNNLTNDTENLLRKAEKNKRYALVNKLADVFIEFKTFLAINIERIFPNLNYTAIESASYLQEIAKEQIENPEHWLCAVASGLTTSLMYDSYNEEDNAHQIIGILPEGMSIEEFLAQNGLTPADGSAENNKKEVDKNKDKKKEKNEKRGKEFVKEYIPTESSKLGFASLGGMKNLKKLLNDRILTALKNPELAKLDEIEYGKKMPKGILLYGPPGCGKTTIVEHLSTEAGVPLLKLEAGTLGSKYIHETSERIDAAFDYAESRAKEKPVLLFLDDADALLLDRGMTSSESRMEEMSSFLNRIQKAGENNVIFVAATNKYDLLDEAVKSRFQEQIFVDLPDKDARKAIIKLFMEQRSKGRELANDNTALEYLALKTDGFPIRALKMISDKASLEALNDGRRNIKTKDFDKIIAKSQNMKVKSNEYKTKNDRTPIGFHQ